MYYMGENSQESLPKPFPKAVIYSDKLLYVCLANYPWIEGHTVVVWKKRVKDLHLLDRKEYEYLMDVVDAVRTAIIKTLGVTKVYLIYMDEINHVHWHLIPRYDEEGFTCLQHEPVKLKDFSLTEKIRNNLKKSFWMEKGELD